MKKVWHSQIGKRPARAGFTLIELLVVVAIVAILSAIALPSYSRYVVKTRRTAAKACLAQYSNYLERYYTTNMKYTGVPIPAVIALDCQTAAQTGNYYGYAYVGTPDASTYKINATPTASQSDAECGTLSINQAGVRTASGTSTTCW